MVQDRRHRSLLQFIERLLSVPAGYAKDDLVAFRSVASRDYPATVPIIDEYIRLAERAGTDVPLRTGKASNPSRVQKAKTDASHMHLFDLLRERRLFPANGDLSEFATRVLPNMGTRRFDKMSRGEIASKVIEYLEGLDPGTREQLEASMRQALKAPAEKQKSDRKSFFSTWEKIIKGIEL